MGYNKAYKFGICLGYTSLVGMNCSLDPRINSNAIYEATCKIYDAILSAVGAPRLDCIVADAPEPAQHVTCEWLDRDREFHGPHPHPEAKTRLTLKHKRAQLLGRTLDQLEAQAKHRMPGTMTQSLLI